MKSILQKINLVIISTIILITYFSCSPKSLKVEDYMNWVEDSTNCLTENISENNIKLSCKYLPKEYYALLLHRNVNNQQKFDSIIKSYDSLMFFKLNIQSDLKDFMTIVRDNRDFFSFKAEEFISLKINNDNQKPILCQYENNFGLKNSISFLCVFKNTNIKNANINFVLDDQVFLHKILDFKFEIQTLKNIPNVVLN